MKTKTTLILAGLFAFCATPLLRANPDDAFDWVARGMIGGVRPGGANYNSSMAYGGTAGVSFGENRRHEINIGVLLVDGWNRKFRDSDGNQTGFCNEAMTLFSANYRRTFMPVPERVKVFVGGGVGMQRVNVDSNMGPKGHYVDVDDPNDPNGGTTSVYVPAPGEITDKYHTLTADATAGISVNIGRGFFVELGYTAMWQNGGSYTLSGGVDGKNQTVRNSSGLTHCVLFAIGCSM